MTQTVKGSLLARGACAWGQKGHLPKGKLDLGRTRFVSIPSRSLKRTALLAWEGACAIQRIRDLFLARLGAPMLSCSHQKGCLARLACQEKREPIRAPIPDMDPHAFLVRGPNVLHLVHPHIRCALFPLESLVPLFSFWGGHAYKGFLGHASKHFSCLRTHGKHGLPEKATSSFVPNVPHAADFVTMRQIDVGGILYQQGHWKRSGLFSGLLKVWLHQCRKGDIWLVQPTLQGFDLFPGVHLNRQRTQRILRQVGGRFDRSSRSTHVVPLDISKGPLGPAFGVQHFLRVHLFILSLCKMWVRIRQECAGVLIGSLSLPFGFEINASQFGRSQDTLHRPSLKLLWHLSCDQKGQPFG
jgi:hypothetical protein